MKNRSVVILIFTLSLLCVLVFAQLPLDLDLPPPPPTPDMGEGSSDDKGDSSNIIIPEQNETEDNQDDEPETNEEIDLLNQGSPEPEEEEPQSSFSFDPGEILNIDFSGDYTIYIMIGSFALNLILFTILLVMIFGTRKNLTNKIESMKLQLDDLRNKPVTQPEVKTEEHKEEKEPEKKEEPQSTLGKYLSENLAQGVNYEDIEKKLVETGWSLEKVKEEYNKIK